LGTQLVAKSTPTKQFITKKKVRGEGQLYSKKTNQKRSFKVFTAAGCCHLKSIQGVTAHLAYIYLIRTVVSPETMRIKA
jgi:hypothetical protein